MMTKNLSKDEVCELLAELKRMGFYDIDSNGRLDRTDPMYDFGTNEPKEINDGTTFYIKVNDRSSRRLSAYEPYMEYVDPRMKALLRFADQYQSTINGLKPYIPDRVGLLIKDREPDPNIYPGVTALPWPVNLPSLRASLDQFVYLTGDQARLASEAFSKGWGGVYSENSKEYIVYAQPFLPDEYLNGEVQEPTPFSMPFQCGPAIE